jgi:hypothetical protein
MHHDYEPATIERYAGSSSTNVWAAVALVCALFGLATYFAAPVGAMLGHVAVRKIRHTGAGGRAMARSAIIVGWSVTLVYSCGFALSAIWVVARGMSFYHMVT